MRERLRVALIVGGFPDARRPGNNVFAMRSAQALSHEVDLSVIVLRAWRPDRGIRRSDVISDLHVETIAVPQLPRSVVANLVFYQQAGWPLVRATLRAVDVVHSGDAASIGVIAGRWARRAGKPHVTQATQLMTTATVPHLWSPALHHWRSEVDAVACNSAALAADIAQTWPELPNVATVYRGVDLQMFHPSGPAYDGLPPRSQVRFLYVGGFPSYRNLPHRANTKGGYTLLRAWADSEEQLWDHGAALVIAGPDCHRDDIQTLHSQLRHPDAVSIVGAIPGESLPALLRSCDAVLVPSFHEGLPNIAVEAGATARPVIGSDIPPLREVVVDGETGLLVPAGDEHLWGAALVGLARDPGRLAGLGRSARRFIEQRFDRRTYAAKMIDLYETVLARNRPACRAS